MDTPSPPLMQTPSGPWVALGCPYLPLLLPLGALIHAPSSSMILCILPLSEPTSLSMLL